jgi:hypothetical protein
LRIVDAVRLKDGGWERVPSQGHTRSVLATEVQITALNWLLTGPGGWLGYRAQAVSSASGGQITWFLGIISLDQAPAIVAVALEDGQSIEAQAIGVELMSAYQAALP